MKTSLLFVALFLFVTSGYSQEMHPHKHDPSESVGVVRFPVSCKPQAQKQFNRAVAWLHSFEYEEAEKAFTEVTVIGPSKSTSCARFRQRGWRSLKVSTTSQCNCFARRLTWMMLLTNIP